MDDDVRKLVDEILVWWHAHEHDTIGEGGDEFNVYEDEPSFVLMAEKLKEKYDGK